MAGALSQDLRDRVVGAIDDGLSRRRAAARFGASVSSAIRRHRLAREHGRAIAGKPGGDRRSSKIDAHAELIMAIVEGKQPEHLTVPRLMSKPLPLSWGERRRDLGIS